MEIGSFWGNCLSVALAQWLLAPFSVRIHCRGRIRRNSWPHFYWWDARSQQFYHFTPNSSELSCRQLLWFEGKIDVDLKAARVHAAESQ